VLCAAPCICVAERAWWNSVYDVLLNTVNPCLHTVIIPKKNWFFFLNAYKLNTQTNSFAYAYPHLKSQWQMQTTTANTITLFDSFTVVGAALSHPLTTTKPTSTEPLWNKTTCFKKVSAVQSLHIHSQASQKTDTTLSSFLYNDYHSRNDTEQDELDDVASCETTWCHQSHYFQDNLWRAWSARSLRATRVTFMYRCIFWPKYTDIKFWKNYTEKKLDAIFLCISFKIYAIH